MRELTDQELDQVSGGAGQVNVLVEVPTHNHERINQSADFGQAPLHNALGNFLANKPFVASKSPPAV